MTTHIVRLWLPDVPGTLGRVAAAIGRASGDVTGIEILERGAGMAIDELLVELPDGASVDDMVTEISRVEGVAVEDVHPVAPDRSDQSVLALEVAASIMEVPAPVRLQHMSDRVCDMLEAEWCAVLRTGEGIPAAVAGDVPDLAWVVAFLDGTRHLETGETVQTTLGDVAWAWIPEIPGAVVCQRQKRSFRWRERQHLRLIARIVGASLKSGTITSSSGETAPPL
ncbi:MAG: ACT domain-containing protein [Ilumatobacteraceae bacterium]